MKKTTLDILIYSAIAFIIMFVPLTIVTISINPSISNALVWSIGLSIATLFPLYHILKGFHKDFILEKYWDKMLISCEYFEKKDYSFFSSGDKSDHWWELHKFVTKFNKLAKLKYYTQPYTYHMGQKDVLTYDTAQIIKHMYNEVNYINALNVDSLKISSVPLYDNTIYERKEIIKRRWELYLTKMDINSEEYKELKLKYDTKFGVNTVQEKLLVLEPKQEIKQKSVDHLNQDLM